jgi:hypothetical protein
MIRVNKTPSIEKIILRSFFSTVFNSLFEGARIHINIGFSPFAIVFLLHLPVMQTGEWIAEVFSTSLIFLHGIRLPLKAARFTKSCAIAYHWPLCTSYGPNGMELESVAQTALRQYQLWNTNTARHLRTERYLIYLVGHSIINLYIVLAGSLYTIKTRNGTSSEVVFGAVSARPSLIYVAFTGGLPQGLCK